MKKTTITTHKRQWQVVGLAVLMAVMLISMFLCGITAIQLKAREESLHSKLAELENIRKEQEIDLAMRKTPEYIEKYAREKLGMTEDGERVYAPR